MELETIVYQALSRDRRMRYQSAAALAAALAQYLRTNNFRDGQALIASSLQRLFAQERAQELERRGPWFPNILPAPGAFASTTWT